MKLSIVTINYNNAEGIRMTMESVLKQTYRDIEYIVVDGASTDGSVDVIREMSASFNDGMSRDKSLNDGISLIWTSEPDKGIYNAMNKGIEIALGRRIVNSFKRSELVEDKNKELCDYIQILNSGDILASDDVVERMVAALDENNNPDILYGNMIKEWPNGTRVNDKCGTGHLSMLSFYFGTLNHDSAYIRRNLFERFGFYDETLKIVSDWKWYMQTIPLGGITPVYVDIDVTIFDMTGVSESNTAFWKVERRPVLEELVPPMILADYDRYGEDMRMMDRLRRYHMYGLVRFIERVLFKFEKWHILRR